MTASDEKWMARALLLATRGGAGTAPNPRVGCVIVAQDGRFLGEGWHVRPGGPHAEIQALNSVPAEDQALLEGATFYVTLEPCAHMGKTPPCADRIVQEKAGRVVVSIEDPFPAVNGQGIQRLRDAGIPVDVGLFSEEARAINERFWVNTLESRPWISLKWAESSDGFLDPRPESERVAGGGGVPVTGAFAQTVVHAMRASHHSILVGRKTAEVDEPLLNNRLAPGGSPVKWVADRFRKLDANHPFFTSSSMRLEELSMKALQSMFRHHGVHSLMIEGGREILQFMLDNMPVDEVVILQGSKTFGGGLPAPTLPSGFVTTRTVRLGDDFAFWTRRTDAKG